MVDMEEESKDEFNLVYGCQMFNCERHFSSLRGLRKHLLYHAGLLPFMCHYCGIAFKFEGLLHTHLNLKHEKLIGEKFKTPTGYITCNICLAMIPFKEKKNHIAIHTPGK